MVTWLLVATLFITSCDTPIVPEKVVAKSSPTQTEAADEFEDAPSGGDFTLMSASGSVSTQDFRGKVVMLYFGYTKCPDVCPTSMLIMSQALDALSAEELAQVQPLFISVDPKRDKVENLSEYARYFHPGFIGITGSGEEVAKVSRMYGARYYQVDLEGSEFGYAVNHSAAIYLVDDQGTLRFIFPHKTPSATVAEAIQHILKEKAAEVAANLKER